MRDLKFRTWSENKNLMTYWGFNLDGNNAWFSGPTNDPKGIQMQYTGVKDSEGREIYEGDIVKFTYWWFDGNEAESELTGEIVYAEMCMSFQLKGVKNKEWEQFTGYENDKEYLTPFSELSFESADFFIIGNIYQNKNLIN